ncbi:MAG: lysine--tRNA ligase [Oscillospiraceae bacterium]|nr:lysine--tRNA ligase [Oscillospiraceae bacterium]
MHWADRIADEIIAREDKQEYVCATGISPSGSVHIGNFRDTVTAWFVCLALRKRGKQARLLYSWDDYDRLRKIPANVAAVRGDYAQYLGLPVSDIPDAYGCCESYCAHFEKEFEQALKAFGVEADYRYQSKEYKSGRYAQHVITAMHRRGEIFDILDSFRTQDAQPGEREAYYPVSIYCPACGKDTTAITSYDETNETAQYTCDCGFAGTFDFKKDHHCKLSWKTDWPMRWMVEGVDFEPAGKDHSSPTGSYATSKVISERVFGYRPPVYAGFEFIGIKGAAGKMSSSTGLNLTPAALFKLYQPEVILWLYAKTDPMKAFNFCFDDEILRQYFEFDKMLTQVREGKADELARDIMGYCEIPGREVKPVPMAQLVSFGSIVEFDPAMLETIFGKIGTPFAQEDFAERAGLAKYWLYQCSPESIYKLRETPDRDYFAALTEEEQAEIRLLHRYLLEEKYDLDELQTKLYAIPADKQQQARFFKNVYRLLIGADRGPRLYLFLYALERESYIGLLDF